MTSEFFYITVTFERKQTDKANDQNDHFEKKSKFQRLLAAKFTEVTQL